MNIFLQGADADQWTQAEIHVGDWEGLAFGDFDGDNDLDVALGQTWIQNPLFPSGEAAMTSTTWAEWSVDPGRDEWSKAATADINGDGKIDIISNDSEVTGGELAWYEPVSPSDPTIGPWTRHTIGFLDYDHSIQIGDIDLDGDLDVVAAEMHQSSDPDEVVVYYNLDGIGTSWDRQVIDTDGSHNIRVIDIDDDGDLDIVGANWRGGPVSLWRNQLGPLDIWERHLVDGARPWIAVLIDSQDIDGDGHNDIITGGWWYKNPGTPSGTWVRNPIGDPLNNMALVHDLDGDTDLDILGTPGKGSESNDTLVWAENDGSGGFTIHSNIPSGNGDFLQGVTVGPITSASTEIYLSWHNNRPIQKLTVPGDPVTGTWTIETASTVKQREDLSQGDIDGDTDVDLLLGTQWLRNDSGTWTAFDLASPLGDPDRNELVDMNGDGKLDAVVGYEAISVAGKLAWYEQGADPTALWTEHIISDTIIGPMSLDVRDMDGDGDFDVAAGEHNLSDPANARLFVYENTDGAGGNWTEHIVYTGDEHHDGARTVDIDGDGDFDIVSIGWNDSPGGVFLYENRTGVTGGLPVANPDSYSVEQDTVMSVIAPGVLSNDVKPGSNIVASLVDDVTNGTLSLNADGSFTYTPANGFTGSDSFTYTVSNDTDTSQPGTVDITVTEPNLPPVATGEDYSVTRGGLLSVDAPGLLSNDSDPNGDALQAQLVSGPSSGDLVLNADGSFEYVHLGGPEHSDSFTYAVSDGTNTSLAVTVSISVQAALPREASGLVVLYTFDEGSGTTVTDSSGSGTPLNLTILDGPATTWSGGKLSVDSSTLISTGVPATKIHDGVTASSEITIEAWVRTSSVSQTGPARMVTLSENSASRNFTVAQQADEFEVRLRTTATNNNGDNPTTTTNGSDVAAAVQHVVYTRDSAGNTRIYVDGVEVQSNTVLGDLSNWDPTYEFGLANEISSPGNSGQDRPWLGEFWLVAVYSAALTQPQVAANFQAGPEAPAAALVNTISGTVSLSGVATGTAAFGAIDPQVTIDSGSWSVTRPVNSDGTFSIAATDGTYTVTAGAAGFVYRQRLNVVVNGSDVALPSVHLDAGLVDADAFVSGADISAVLGSLGVPVVDRTNGFNSNIVDLNADDAVNVLDASLVVTSFGKTSPEFDW